MTRRPSSTAWAKSFGRDVMGMRRPGKVRLKSRRIRRVGRHGCQVRQEVLGGHGELVRLREDLQELRWQVGFCRRGVTPKGEYSAAERTLVVIEIRNRCRE